MKERDRVNAMSNIDPRRAKLLHVVGISVMCWWHVAVSGMHPLDITEHQFVVLWTSSTFPT